MESGRQCTFIADPDPRFLMIENGPESTQGLEMLMLNLLNLRPGEGAAASFQAPQIMIEHSIWYSWVGKSLLPGFESAPPEAKVPLESELGWLRWHAAYGGDGEPVLPPATKVEECGDDNGGEHAVEMVFDLAMVSKLWAKYDAEGNGRLDRPSLMCLADDLRKILIASRRECLIKKIEEFHEDCDSKKDNADFLKKLAVTHAEVCDSTNFAWRPMTGLDNDLCLLLTGCSAPGLHCAGASYLRTCRTTPSPRCRQCR